MVERGERVVSSELASRAVEVFEVPATALPLTEYSSRAHDAGFFQTSWAVWAIRDSPIYAARSG
jgi:hypothetical protein